MRKRSLLLELTLPTVLVVLAFSLGSSHLLGVLFERTHEEGADDRVARLGDQLVARLAHAPGGHHGNLEELLPAIGAASGKVVLVTDAARRVRWSSRPQLIGTELTGAQLSLRFVTHDSARFARHVRPLPADLACARCHADVESLGLLAIDSPRESAEREVVDQQRANLLGGLGLALVLSLVLVAMQSALLYGPLLGLKQTLERIRGGDLEARALVHRPDELGELAATVNEMAVSLARAREELDRTHRAELAQTEKLATLGELTSTVAHEIKNPLAGIIGALRVLEAEARADDPNKAVLGKLLSQAEKLSRTAVELLDFARPLRPSLQEVQLPELLDRAVFFVERQAAAQKIELRRRFPTGLPAAHVDPDLVRQVFLNVLLNGIQSMPRGGALDLAVSAVEGGAALEVAITDQGPGIPQEQLAKIFTPFFTTRPGGTGLGLSIARQLVETQRGELRVESRLGHGSTFTIRLPTRAPVAATEEPADAPRQPPDRR